MPRKKKKGVTVQVNELITQPRKMASLPALNSRIGQRTMLAVLQRLQGLFNLAKEKENMRVKDRQLYFNFESEDFEVDSFEVQAVDAVAYGEQSDETPVELSGALTRAQSKGAVRRARQA